MIALVGDYGCLGDLYGRLSAYAALIKDTNRSLTAESDKVGMLKLILTDDRQSEFYIYWLNKIKNHWEFAQIHQDKLWGLIDILLDSISVKEPGARLDALLFSAQLFKQGYVRLFREEVAEEVANNIFPELRNYERGDPDHDPLFHRFYAEHVFEQLLNFVYPHNAMGTHFPDFGKFKDSRIALKEAAAGVDRMHQQFDLRISLAALRFTILTNMPASHERKELMQELIAYINFHRLGKINVVNVAAEMKAESVAVQKPASVVSAAQVMKKVAVVPKSSAVPAPVAAAEMIKPSVAPKPAVLAAMVPPKESAVIAAGVPLQAGLSSSAVVRTIKGAVGADSKLEGLFDAGMSASVPSSSWTDMFTSAVRVDETPDIGFEQIQDGAEVEGAPSMSLRLNKP